MIKLAAVLGLIFAILIGSTPALADKGPDPAEKRYVIRFKPGVSAEEKTGESRNRGARLERDIEHLSAQVVYMPEGRAAALSNIVESIEPDYIVTVDQTPNDPYYPQEWGMLKVQASQAWDVTQGNSAVRIAILDTGIDRTHPDLAAKIVSGQNFSISTNPGDVFGHGTHVAGIAAAIANNGVGVAGLGYNASLMNVKVMGDNGSGYTSDIAAGIVWATDNGANVINLSLGGPSPTTVMQQAIDYAWSHGVVVVAAAGNNSTSSPSYPAYYPPAIAVAATDKNDALYYFSNYGSWVDTAAPGNALSTLAGGGYGYMSGTSMASPHVAGLAGLIFAAARDTNGNGMKNDEVRAIIEYSADNIGISGIGSGRINAYKAAIAAAPAPNTGTISGTISDAASLAPISGATISDGTRTAVSGVNGSYTLSYVPAGAYTVTASAAGYQGASRSVSLTAGQTVTANFTLIRVNRPPTLNPIGNKTVAEGQLLQFTVTGSDLDGDPLTFSAYNLPPGAGFSSSTRVFTWTPAPGQAASYPGVTFSVSDGKATTSESIVITVNLPVSNAMWVESALFSTTSSRLNVTTKIVSPAPVAGASIRVYLYYNGRYVSSSTRTTNTSGNASFSFNLRGSGQYTVVVNRLTHAAFTWDRTKGITSATYNR